MKGKILILTDGKAGHENQSKAFARALGFDFDLVEIHFRSGFAKALSYLFDNLNICTTGLVRVTKGTLLRERGTYAAVIGTGSGTFYMAKVLARRLGVKCGVVLYPRAATASPPSTALWPPRSIDRRRRRMSLKFRRTSSRTTRPSTTRVSRPFASAMRR